MTRYDHDGIDPLAPIPPELPRNVSGLGKAALICGILGLCLFPLAIVALICGIIGINKAKSTDPGQGMALAGTILGAVALTVVPVLALMLGILLPALDKAHELANRAVCAANMRGICQGLYTYADNHDDRCPPYMGTLVLDGTITAENLRCPSSDTARLLGDGESILDHPASWYDQHSDYIYLRPSEGFWRLADAIILYEKPDNHREAGINICFGDGHFRFVPMPEAIQLLRRQGVDTSNFPRGP